MTGPRFLPKLGIAALDYLRWTQLVPMFVAWSMLALGLWTAVAVYLQETAPTAGKVASGVLYVVLESTGLSENGKVSVSGGFGELADWLGPLWMVAALIGMIGSRLTPAPIKRLAPKTLGARLLWAAITTVVAASALCCVILLTDHQGDALSFVLVFGLFAVFGCGASVYSLTVSHVLKKWIAAIRVQAQAGASQDEATSAI